MLLLYCKLELDPQATIPLFNFERTLKNEAVFLNKKTFVVKHYLYLGKDKNAVQEGVYTLSK
jgi:hypothetical protein